MVDIISGTATGVGAQSTLTVASAGESVNVNLSGTYDMTVQLEREVGSPSSGAWEVVLGPFTTANATVAETYITKSQRERLRLNVTVDTSGTVVYDYSHGNKQLKRFVDDVGILSYSDDQEGRVFEKKFTVKGEFRNEDTFTYFDDFTQQTLTEVDEIWILNSGTDAQAIDPAINAQEGGVVRITTGDLDGTTAADGAQMVAHVPVQADSGELVVEARLHINTAVTDVSINFGITDITTLEEPFTIATSTITSNASNAVCFVYDTAATTDEWFACGVDGNTDATGNGTVGVAPVADVYQVLRIEIAADGESAKFFVDGVLKKTLTASVCAASTNLYATIIACATTTTSKTVDVDYVKISHNR